MYGLSTDSPKSNTTFKNKQKLPYTLLCDPSASLISAIGMKKAPKGTTRGVVVINKQAKVEVVFTGVRRLRSGMLLPSVANFKIQGPAATVDEVRNLISNSTEASEGVGDFAEGETAGLEIEKPETESRKYEELKHSEPPNRANGDKAQAEVAAEVADSAQKLDQRA